MGGEMTQDQMQAVLDARPKAEGLYRPPEPEPGQKLGQNPNFEFKSPYDQPDQTAVTSPVFIRASGTNEIAAALLRAQKKFTPVEKKRTATVQMRTGGSYTFDYADLSDILDMVRPILNGEGILLWQPSRRREGKLYIVTQLIHPESGQTMESDGLLISESLERQPFGRDQTYDRRYDLCAVLGIAAEDDKDAGLASERKKPGRPKTEQKDEPAPEEPDLPTSAEQKKYVEKLGTYGQDMKKLGSFVKKTAKVKNSKEMTKTQWEDAFKALDELKNSDGLNKALDES